MCDISNWCNRVFQEDGDIHLFLINNAQIVIIGPCNGDYPFSFILFKRNIF